MARSRTDKTVDQVASATPLRLRIPAALAVALVGAGATVAMSFGGCQEDSIPDPVPDAGRIDKPTLDGSVTPDGDVALADGGVEVADAPVTPPPPPADAPRDAYVPPDTPVG